MSINKKILIALLFITIFIVDIGYAKFSDASVTNETVNTSGKFDIDFENIEIIKSCGIKNESNIPTISENEILLDNIDLMYPGAGIEYSVDIVNNGSIPAEINSIVIDGLENCRAIKVTIDDVSVKVLSPRQRTNVHFKIYWDENVSENVNEKVDYKIKINYLQVF